MKRLGWLASIPIVALVVLVAVWESQALPAPGPLHPTHATVAALQGNSGCAACHGTDSTSLSASCLACHEPIAEDIRAATGLHGALPAEQQHACASCHPDHAGSALPLVGDLAFRESGVDPTAAGAHAFMASFGLAGRHAALGCAACHEHADAPRLEPGQRRFGGLAQTCTACHADIHDGAFGTDCASCHGQEHPFPTVATFAHTDAFPLADAHAGLACSDCHDAPTAIATGDVRPCAACHDSPHRTTFLDQVRGMDDHEGGCARCHDAVAGGFARPHARLDAEEHAATGFALVPPHDNVDCAACHGDASDFDRLPRQPEDCAACHGDPHAGQFDDAPSQGRCLACHDPHGFLPSTIDAAAHAATDFALTGAHIETDCHACHLDVAGVRRFDSTPTACAACHDDVHAGQFDDPGAPTSCATCHSTAHFAPSLFDSVRHEACGFALSGAHAEIACNDCHEPVGDVRRFAGTPSACASCHDDVHGAQFGAAPDCASCHTDAAFVPARFDHARHARTAFPLTGAHRAIACSSCHPHDGPSRRFVPTPTTCAACHADVHAGAFDGLRSVDGVVETCTACHGTAAFRPVTTVPADHERWTGIALQGAHASLECVACHARSPQRGSGDITLGPAGTSCASCHTDPHAGQFDLGGVTDCTQCHGQDTFDRLRFDHDRDARFALDEVHAALDCDACHRPVPTSRGPVVRYRPLGMTCRDCHGPTPGGAQ